MFICQIMNLPVGPIFNGVYQFSIGGACYGLPIQVFSSQSPTQRIPLVDHELQLHPNLKYPSIENMRRGHSQFLD